MFNRKSRLHPQEIEADIKGRWIISIIKINKVNTYIVNIHWVWQGKAGPTSVARQQINYNHENGLNYKPPRKSFMDDFDPKLKEYMSRYKNIKILGDLNES